MAVDDSRMIVARTFADELFIGRGRRGQVRRDNAFIARTRAARGRFAAERFQRALLSSPILFAEYFHGARCDGIVDGNFASISGVTISRL